MHGLWNLDSPVRTGCQPPRCSGIHPSYADEQFILALYWPVYPKCDYLSDVHKLVSYFGMGMFLSPACTRFLGRGPHREFSQLNPMTYAIELARKFADSTVDPTFCELRYDTSLYDIHNDHWNFKIGFTEMVFFYC